MPTFDRAAARPNRAVRADLDYSDQGGVTPLDRA